MDPLNLNDSQLDLAERLIESTNVELNIRKLINRIDELKLLPMISKPKDNGMLDDQLEEQQGEKAALLEELCRHKEVTLSALSGFYACADAPAVFRHYEDLVSWLEAMRQHLLRRRTECAVLAKEKTIRDRKLGRRGLMTKDVNEQIAAGEGRVKGMFHALDDVESHLASGPKAQIIQKISSDSPSSRMLLPLERALANVHLLQQISLSRQHPPPITTDPDFTWHLAKINDSLMDLKIANNTCNAEIMALHSRIDSELAVDTESCPPDSPLLRPIEISVSDVNAAVGDIVHDSFRKMAAVLSQKLSLEFSTGADDSILLHAWKLLERPMEIIEATVKGIDDTETDVDMPLADTDI